MSQAAPERESKGGTQEVGRGHAKKRLAIIWLAGAAFLVATLMLQTVLGRFGEEADDAWEWLLPTLMPTLSLIVGAWVTEAKVMGVTALVHDRFLAQLALTLSIAYLVAVTLTIYLSPFSPMEPIELMRKSNLWLGPMQGIVGAAMGVFFTTRQASEADLPAAP